MLSHPRLADSILTRHHGRRDRSPFRLRVEALEDRSVPTTLTWTGALSANWGDSAVIFGNTVTNWSGNQLPAAGDVLRFDNTASGHFTNTNDLSGPLNTPFVVSAIILADDGYTLQGNPIAIDSGSGIQRVGASTGLDTVGFDITLSTDQAWVVSQPLLVTGAVKGGGNLTKVGFGTLRLAGDSTYDGSTDIVVGTVRVESDHGLGSRNTGTTVESGASLIYDGGSIYQTQVILNNYGSLEIKTGELKVKTGENTGTILVDAGASIRFRGGYVLGPGSELLGDGTYEVSQTTSTDHLTINGSVSIPNFMLGDAGTVEVQSGNLTVLGGASTGTISVPSGSAVSFTQGFDFNAGSTITGGGLIHVEPASPGPIVNVNADLILPNLDVGAGGMLELHTGRLKLGTVKTLGKIRVHSGSALSIEGAFDSQPGSTLENLPGGTIEINTVELVSYNGGQINNSGHLSWLGSGNLLFANAASLNNIAEGLIEIRPAEPPSAEPPSMILNSGSTLNNAAGAVIEIDTAEPVSIGGGTVNNSGRVSLIGSGNIELPSDTTLNNLPGGLIEFHPAEPPSAEPPSIGLHSGAIINNALGATVDVNAAEPVSITGGGLFQNEGTVNIVQQTLIVGDGDGTVAGNGSFHGNIVSRGTLAPGSTLGHMTIDGDLILDPVGKLVLELGGTTAGSEYDQLAVSGAVTFGGALEIDLVNGFVPAIGSVFQSIQFGSSSGTFAQVKGNRFDGNRLAPYVAANGLTLIAQAPAVGPFVDADGDIYSFLLKGPGTASVFLNDPDRDGRGSIEQVLLQGTDEALSRLAINVRHIRGGNGLGAVGEIDGTGLKSLTLGRADLAGFLGTALNFTGNLGSVNARSIGDATIQAASIGTLRVTGDFKADLTLTGPGGLGRATIDGAVTNSTIQLAGGLGYFHARSVSGTTILAASIGRLIVTGDFQGDVTLTGTAGLGLAIVGGAVSDSVFQTSAGSAGYFQAGAFVNSELFIGFTPNDSADPLAGGAFVPNLEIGSFRVTRSRTPGFVNSVVAAATIERARFVNVLTENAGQEFGLIGQQIGRVSAAQPAFVFGPGSTSVGDFRVVAV